MALMICVFHVPATPPTYCNICLMELICVNDSNAKNCNLFKLYFSFMDFESKWMNIYCHKQILYSPYWYMYCLIDLFQWWVCVVTRVVINCGLNVCGSCLQMDVHLLGLIHQVFYFVYYFKYEKKVLLLSHPLHYSSQGHKLTKCLALVDPTIHTHNPCLNPW